MATTTSRPVINLTIGTGCRDGTSWTPSVELNSVELTCVGGLAFDRFLLGTGGGHGGPRLQLISHNENPKPSNARVRERSFCKSNEYAVGAWQMSRRATPSD